MEKKQEKVCKNLIMICHCYHGFNYLSVYKGDKYFELLRNNSEKKISDDKAINIINSQVKFLQMRLPNLRNITFNKFINLI